MRKTLLLLPLAILAALPFTVQAATTSPQDFLPDTAIITADVSLHGTIKDLLAPLITSGTEEATSEDSARYKEKATVLRDQFLSGQRFTIAGINVTEAYVVFPTTTEQWQMFIQGNTKEDYGSAETYVEDAVFFTRLGNFIVLTSSSTALHTAIDLADGKTTNNLARSTDYVAVTSKLLDPRLLGVTINIKAGYKALAPLLASGEDEGLQSAMMTQANQLLEGISKLFSFEGLSLEQTATGYSFTTGIKGDEAFMTTNGVSLNPQGTFTPKLFSRFPQSKPLFYAESFNAEASQVNEDKILKILMGDSAAEFDSLYADIEDEIGFNPKDLSAVLDQEYAFGVQSNGGLIPVATFMGNVSNNRVAAQAILAKMVTAFTNLLNEGENAGSYTVSSANGFTKFTIDLSKITEDYTFPKLDPVVITAGISEDGMLIVSNAPGIENRSVQLGFASDADFAAYPQAQQSSSGIAYVNARNTIQWIDSLMDVVNTYSYSALQDRKEYIKSVGVIYPWKDAMLVANGTATYAEVKGWVRVDKEKYPHTFENYINEIKEADADDDGVSDFDERYLYNTSSTSADSDSDGENDVDELKSGADPLSSKRLFTDVDEGAYYTDEVGLLYQKGAISGYADKSFQPGKLVNRAEFVQMVMKALTPKGGGFFAAGSSFFSDVDENAWYFNTVRDAYNLGIISGSSDKNGNQIFRPGDPITRAEALAILAKASSALGKDVYTASCTDTPFEDVSSEDWFCGAVGNGFKNGITKGRESKKFAPFGTLNRAEAAVMIRRTLEKDVDYSTEDHGGSSGLIPLYSIINKIN